MKTNERGGSVVEGVVDAIWFNQGQVCCAGSRILAQEGIAPKLEARLKARMETLRVGDPLDKAVDIGAIIAPVQLEKIRELVSQGEEEGARMWQPSWSCPTEGYFYPPTLFTDVAPSATVAQVEIFGPVVTGTKAGSVDEIIELGNDTDYGLAASVWTNDLRLAHTIAPKIQAGTVWFNLHNFVFPSAPYPGYKASGVGFELGKEGVLALTRIKNVMISLFDGGFKWY